MVLTKKETPPNLSGQHIKMEDHVVKVGFANQKPKQIAKTLYNINISGLGLALGEEKDASA